CHIDQTLAWTSTRLQEWYRIKQRELPPASTELSHMVNLALSGDAGQRVLAAAALSWTPALNASSTNWITPILAQLLDDPYAAVRGVAERSCRKNGIAMPQPYDYSLDPKSRPSARDQLWKEWESTAQPLSNSQVLISQAGGIERDRFEA